MKRLGFKKEIMINVYRSLVQSHFISSAIVLCSVSKATMQKMEKIQTRFLKIIEIEEKTAKYDYKLDTVEKTIDLHCKNILQRVLNDQKHPTTLSLTRRENTKSLRYQFPYVINKCKTIEHQNSYLQKYIRILEDEQFTPNLHQTMQSSHDQTIGESSITSEENDTTCKQCGRSNFVSMRGLQQHIRIAHKNNIKNKTNFFIINKIIIHNLKHTH